jgi:hypothetical protein
MSVRSIRFCAFLRQIDFILGLNSINKTSRVGGAKSKYSKSLHNTIWRFLSNGQPEIRLSSASGLNSTNDKRSSNQLWNPQKSGGIDKSNLKNLKYINSLQKITIYGIWSRCVAWITSSRCLISLFDKHGIHVSRCSFVISNLQSRGMKRQNLSIGPLCYISTYVIIL